jgi:hypothetical protein
MILTIERLGLSRTQKLLQTLCGHIRQDKPNCTFIPTSFLLLRLESRFIIVFIPTDTGIGGTLFSAFLHRLHRTVSVMTLNIFAPSYFYPSSFIIISLILLPFLCVMFWVALLS